MTSEVINVLLVEDDLSTSEFVKQVLCDCSKTVRFTAESAEDLSRAVELLNSKDFDIVLLDIKLPDSTGVDAVKQVHTLNPYIPVVLITELADEEIGLRAIKNGADDYLVKGKIFKDVLGRSIRYAIERKKERLRSENALKEEKNRAQKYLDVAQVILVALNPDQKVAMINKKGC
ncbi:response regulator, partial [bacterium]|nr:response regulator [bacterium]